MVFRLFEGKYCMQLLNIQKKWMDSYIFLVPLHPFSNESLLFFCTRGQEQRVDP